MHNGRTYRATERLSQKKECALGQASASRACDEKDRGKEPQSTLNTAPFQTMPGRRARSATFERGIEPLATDAHPKVTRAIRVRDIA